MPDRRGVTLLELLTVLAILAVLSGVSGFWLLRGLPERRMMSAARELYCGLRQAQARAVARGSLITVNFSPESDTFSLTDTEGKMLLSKSLDSSIDLYDVRGGNANRFFFNARGIKTGVSGSVRIRSRKPGYDELRVAVRATGSMAIQRSSDNGETWE